MMKRNVEQEMTGHKAELAKQEQVRRWGGPAGGRAGERASRQRSARRCREAQLQSPAKPPR